MLHTKRFNYKRSFIFVLFVLTFQFINAQSKVIKGVVFDTNNQPIDYFTAALLSADDSTILVGGAFADGHFSLDCSVHAKGVLQISSVGYEQQLVNIQFNNSAFVNVDTLVLKSITIGEVTVKSSRPKITHQPNATMVDVENTSLSNVGSSLDVLKRVPGIQFDNLGNLTVMGKNSPTIIINNREIRTFNELELLQSSTIKSIEIKSNSSARHNASGNAVIVIKTARPLGNQLNGQVYNRFFVARKINNRVGAALNFGSDNINSFLTVENIHRNNIHYINDYFTNYQPLYTLENQSSKKNHLNDKTNRASLGTNIKMGNTSEMGIYYQFYKKQKTDKSAVSQTIHKEHDEIRRAINQHATQNEMQHNFSLSYTINLDSMQTINMLADFALQNDNEDVFVTEKNLNSQYIINQQIKNKNQFKVLTFKSDYEKKWQSGFEILSGVKMAGIINDGSTNFVNLMSLQRVTDNNQTINDVISAAYLQSGYTINKWSFKGGLRGENTNTKIEDYGYTLVDSNYFNLFPSFAATYSINTHRYATFNYSKTISRPLFKELNPSMTYYDSLMIGEGNPLLRPAISHNVGIEWGLARNVYVLCEYKHRNNARIKSALPDSDNPDIIKFKPVNVPKSASLNLSLGAGYTGKSLSVNTYSGITMPFDNIPYLGKVIKNRMPGWFLSVNTDYNFSSNLMCYLQVDYRSKYSELMSVYGETLDVSGGVQASLCQKKLSIALDISDLFNTSDPRWVDKYGQIKIGRKPDYDIRYLRFIVSYKFNNFKSLHKSSAGNNDELNRL